MSGDSSRQGRDVSPVQPALPAAVRPALIGRERPLGQLARLAATTPAYAVIEGPAGVGKTRLVWELRERPEIADRRFLLGACRHIREPRPLAPIGDALRHLAEGLDAIDLPPTASALLAVVPELGPRLPTSSKVEADRAARRRQLFKGTRDVLAALGPAVLVIDDAHWIDTYTLDFLRSLVVDPLPDVTVLVTYRDGEVPAGVRELADQLAAGIERVDIDLRPLSAIDTRALVADLLGVDEVSAGLASYVYERSSGQPLAIQELLVLLWERGVLADGGADWSYEALAELAVPRLLRDQMLERLDRLSDNGRAVAESAAALQLPVSLSTLVGACGLSDQDALLGVDEALEAGLLVEADKLLGYRHLLAAQAVYAGIPLVRKQRLHRQAAASLEQLWPVPLGQLTYHRHAAGQPSAWVKAAERTADEASAAGDDAEAARLLDLVLREAQLDTGQRTRLAAKLGRVALDTAHPGPLIAPLSDALRHEDELPPQSRGKLHFWLGLLLHQTGRDPQRQRDLFARAVDEFEGQPELAAAAMICLALGSAAQVSEQLIWVRRAREILPRVEDPGYEIFLQGKVGSILMLAGDADWRQATERIFERTRGRPEQRHEVRAFSTIVSSASWAGHHDVASDWLARARSAGHRSEDALSLRLRGNAAVLDFCRGRWSGLRERTEGLRPRFAEQPRLRIELDAVTSRLALAAGDLDTAAQQVDDLLRDVDRLEAFDLLPTATETRIRLALAAGDSEAAVAAATRLRDLLEPGEVRVAAARALPAAVDAMIAAGRAEEAGRWLTALGPELHERDAPLAPAAAEHAYGLLAADEGHWDAAVAHFQTAAARYDASGSRYENALAHEQAGRAQLVAEPPGAEPLVRTAATTYRALGARHDFDRLAGIARVHGVSLPSRQTGGRRGNGGMLSPREREVAELAAAGHTNKEIAQDLYVSVNTVKKQLSSAMRKLGVRSRSALSDRLNPAT